MKEFRSLYFHEHFSDKLLMSRLLSGFAVFVGTFALTGIYFREGKRRRSLILNVFDGLSQMSFEGLLITFVVAIILTIIVVAIFNQSYGGRKIIVGLSFNNKDKTLNLRVRAVGDVRYNDHSIPYSRIAIRDEQLSDGMTGPMYDCVTFMANGSVLGHYYREHEMWRSFKDSDIQKEINNIRF